MNVAAFTIAYGKEAVTQARLLRATFKVSHPEIPLFVVDESFWPFFARQPRAAHTGEISALRTLVGHFLGLCFDRVVYFDADVLILAPIPRLLEARAGEPAVLLTRDKASFNYGNAGLPSVNSGIVASSNPDFWLIWAMTIYSSAPRLVGNFFDQFTLRLLALQNAFPHLIVPDREEGEYHNIGYLDLDESLHPWRREGDAAFKGDARIRIWHWAGYGNKPSPFHLPAPLREVAMARLEQARAMQLPPYEEENRALHAATRSQPLADQFYALVENEFRSLPFDHLDSLNFPHRTPPPGLFGCDAPAAWESLRIVPPHLHRRLLPHGPRYLYALSEERLREADVEAYDRPLGG
ncbi:hypothetical protein SAMN05444156_1313 [Verrucomicrobium sp. GAS474]|uniref:hypothetical protein n=1 Tax=Verrucomicrobium sp. GAS474 TaxID=1882831 RepID=UPI0008797AB5|nr:hypothetical protein [Verrucomicrobium sp. GAS474]SDT99347.1 hypothetical protein SAMN05444156_1313 [Verrucomicrobium sp. GAS474]